MKIGIIGSGRIGGNLARLFAEAGHRVAISNSRGPDSLKDLESEIGPNAQAMTVSDAARFGDIVVLAAPWRNTEALPDPYLVKGKIVIDAMNPYSPTGEVLDLGSSTSSEETARRLPGARIVKAFNTMYFETLRTGGRKDRDLKDRLVLFLAGDDEPAKAIVAKLIEDIGFTPVDTGSLREGGRRQQPGTALYNHPMTSEEARELLAGTR